EVLDFAAALYDRDICLLAQAPTLPVFMGTMSFCVRGAIDAVGGEQALEPGDIILYNDPFGTGSHPQDAAMVMPVFLPAGDRVGYAAIQAHWLERFDEAVAAMYDHGEALVKEWFARLPQGRYIGRGEMDSNGVTDDPVPFEVTVDISPRGMRLDFSDGPPQQEKPINCPLPSTMSASRIAISMLAGGGTAPN